MAKGKKKTDHTQEVDQMNHFDQPEVWDILDPGDQSFWEEFFRLEELLETTDELDPPSFSISIQNHQTGEVKTFSHISLKPAISKLLC
jgi:hypothetical protein